VRFWDTSALVPLVLLESTTDQLEGLLSEDAVAAIWWGTPVELESAIARSHREGRLDGKARRAAIESTRAILDRALEIEPSEAVRERAQRLVRSHPLRAADGLQLAAALTWCEGQPAGSSLVSLDHRLREAAMVEGFDVLPGRA
jgi:predicted nucleic acid-binding protein